MRAGQSFIVSPNQHKLSVVLCVLCASVVKPSLRSFHHRGTESTEVHGDYLQGILLQYWLYNFS